MVASLYPPTPLLLNTVAHRIALVRSSQERLASREAHENTLDHLRVSLKIWIEDVSPNAHRSINLPASLHLLPPPSPVLQDDL